MWGVVSAPIFNKDGGILYVGDKLSFKILGWNLIGGVCIIAWTAFFSAILFNSLKFFKRLRDTHEVESKGTGSYDSYNYTLIHLKKPTLKQSIDKFRLLFTSLLYQTQTVCNLHALL